MMTALRQSRGRIETPPPIELMQRAGQLIGKLKISRDPADAEARARAAWRVAAGKKIAEHTRATAVVRGSLIVEVEDVVWQRQLNTLRHFLVRNLNSALGEAMITEIDFRPMPPRREPQRAMTARPGQIEDPVLDLLYRRSQGYQQSRVRNMA
jgi:predicted nucleic acid-binding Zn ribbon protein